MSQASKATLYAAALIGAATLIWLAWQYYPANPLPRLTCQPHCAQVNLDTA